MRLAMVVPRYGADILGGAESAARGLAEQLVARGYTVDVLTTCVRDLFTWANELAPGETVLNGVRVRRFRVSEQWDRGRYAGRNLMIAHGQIPLAEQYAWLEEGPHCPELYAFLAQRPAVYDLLLFIPYLFPTTLYGAMIAPEKSIIWPCLHDEYHAWLEPTRVVLSSVRGLMFNSEPERTLAQQLGVTHAHDAVIGLGLSDEVGDAERFRAESGLRAPFVLYSGRLETAKNLPLLLRYFIDYKRACGGPLKLVLMGHGPETIPKHPDIVAIGFRQGQPKLDVYAAATVLCQPSVNESFSLVTMEAWLNRVPVLVHAHCAVTRHHTQRSQGGLYFATSAEFAGAMDWMIENEAPRKRMGANGRRYVTQYYNWDAVVRRFEAAVPMWPQDFVEVDSS